MSTRTNCLMLQEFIHHICWKFQLDYTWRLDLDLGLLDRLVVSETVCPILLEPYGPEELSINLLSIVREVERDHVFGKEPVGKDNLHRKLFPCWELPDFHISLKVVHLLSQQALLQEGKTTLFSRGKEPIHYTHGTLASSHNGTYIAEPSSSRGSVWSYRWPGSPSSSPAETYLLALLHPL